MVQEDLVQEIQQVLGLAVCRAQVYVGNENAPVAPHLVSRLSTSPDGATLASSGDGEMTTGRQLYDVQKEVTGEEIAVTR